MSAERVRAGGAYVELKLTDNEFRKGLKRSEQAMREWVRNNKKELAKFEKQFRDSMARMERFLFKQIPNKLNAAVGAIGKVSQAAVSMGGSINKGIRAAASGVDRFLSGTANLVSFKRVNKMISMINHSVMQFGASMRRSGFDMLFAGGAVTLGFGSTLKDLTSLDKILSSIRGTVPFTAEEFTRLKNTIRKVGETSQFTAHEVAEVALQLTKAGVQLGKMDPAGLDKLLRSMVGFGLASGIEDLGELTEIAVQATGAFGALDNANPQSVVQRVNRTMNIMVAASNRSAMSVRDMFEAWKMSAPMAQQIGMRQSQLAGLIGALADTGVKGTLAGTSLRRMFTNLATPDKIEKLNDAMKRFGLSAVRTTDDLGNLRSVSAILRDLAPQIRKLGSAARISLATEVFDVRGANAALSLMQSIADVEKKSLSIMMDRNALIRKAREMQNSFFGLVKRTSSAFQELKLKIAEALQPLAETGLRGVLVLINQIKNNKDQLAKFVKIASLVGASAMAAGAVMITLGSSIMLVASSLAAVVSIAIPVTAALVAIAATGKRVTDIFNSLRDALKDIFRGGVDELFKKMGDSFDSIVSSIRKAVVGFNLFIGGLRSAIALVSTFAQFLVSGVIVWVMRLVANVQLALSTMAGLLSPAMGLLGIFQTLKGFFTGFVSVIKDVMAAFSAGAKTILGVVGMLGKMLGQMLRMEAIAEAIKITFGGIGKFITSMINSLGKVLPQLQGLASALQGAVGRGDMDLAGAVVTNMFKTLGSVIYDSFVSATDYMQNEIMRVFGPLIVALSDLKGLTKGSNVTDEMLKFGNRIKDEAMTVLAVKELLSQGKGGEAGRLAATTGDPMRILKLAGLDGNTMEVVGLIGDNIMSLAPSIGRNVERIMTGDFTQKIVGSVLLLGDILTLGFASLLDALAGLMSAMGFGGVAEGTRGLSDNLIGMWQKVTDGVLMYERKVRKASDEKLNKMKKEQAKKKQDRDNQRQKQAAENERVINADKNSRALAKMWEKFLSFNVTDKGKQDFAWMSQLPRMFQDLFSTIQSEVTMMLNNPLGYLQQMRDQMLVSSVSKNRAKAEEAVKTMAGILRTRLGNVNLSRAAGAMGHGAAALAGTRYESIDKQQLGELRKANEKLDKANAALKKQGQPTVKFKFK